MFRWIKRKLFTLADPLMNEEGEMIPFPTKAEEDAWKRRCDRKDRLRGLNRLLSDSHCTPEAIQAYINANEEWDCGFAEDATTHIFSWWVMREAMGEYPRGDLDRFFPSEN